MNRDAIIAAARDLVATEKTGFTIDQSGREYSGSVGGFAVAEQTFDRLEDAVDHLGPEQFLGYWVDAADGRGYYETVDIYVSMFWAVTVGLARGQRFLYDFAADDVLDLQQLQKGTTP